MSKEKTTAAPQQQENLKEFKRMRSNNRIYSA